MSEAVIPYEDYLSAFERSESLPPVVRLASNVSYNGTLQDYFAKACQFLDNAPPEVAESVTFMWNGQAITISRAQAEAWARK